MEWPQLVRGVRECGTPSLQPNCNIKETGLKWFFTSVRPPVTIAVPGAFVIGNENVIGYLNEVLWVHLRAVNQYALDGEILAGWSYRDLGRRSRRQATAKRQQAEALSKRILALGGAPCAGCAALPIAGKNAKDLLDSQLGRERAALSCLHDAISAARDAGDGSSLELLETILAEGEEQVDWLEVQLFMIREIGVENFLAAQIGAQGNG